MTYDEIEAKLTDKVLSEACEKARAAGVRESFERWGVGHHCGPTYAEMRKHILAELFK